MNASRRFVMWGLIPAGGLLGGVLASAVSFLPLAGSRLREIVRTEDAEEIARTINEEFALTAETQVG